MNLKLWNIVIGKIYADVVNFGLCDKNIKNKNCIQYKLSEYIYFIGLALIVCTQFELERKLTPILLPCVR